jgi:two-component system chemotaxis response regulator CheY
MPVLHGPLIHGPFASDSGCADHAVYAPDLRDDFRRWPLVGNEVCLINGARPFLGLVERRRCGAPMVDSLRQGVALGGSDPVALPRGNLTEKIQIYEETSMRALVADDSGTIRKIIIRSLNHVGITDVAEAADGAEALAMFSQGQFGLVLTDWNMPNKNGLEVIEGIRGQGSQVPILMITTEAEKRRVLDAIRAGVTDYLVKPFDSDVLREKLKKILPN